MIRARRTIASSTVGVDVALVRGRSRRGSSIVEEVDKLLRARDAGVRSVDLRSRAAPRLRQLATAVPIRRARAGELDPANAPFAVQAACLVLDVHDPAHRSTIMQLERHEGKRPLCFDHSFARVRYAR